MPGAPTILIRDLGGRFNVVRRDRHQRIPPIVPSRWIEYQVRYGRNILARHAIREEAIADAERRFAEYYKSVM